MCAPPQKLAHAESTQGLSAAEYSRPVESAEESTGRRSLLATQARRMSVRAIVAQTKRITNVVPVSVLVNSVHDVFCNRTVCWV